jgi:RNA polymerase sigma-70 factor (ECF subfamily)
LSLQAHQASDCATSADAKPPEPLEVAALTRRMAQGDETAYRTFYEAYFDRLSRYLLVVTAGDEEAAREALQSTLLRVVRHIKVFPSDAVFWSWLTVLARSALSDQNRRRRRYLAFLDRFTWHSRTQQAFPDDPEADARLAALLETNLGALPLDERRLVEAKYFERRSVREIAGDLSLSEKAVESRLVRIRQKLKTAILDGLTHD